MVSEKQLGMTHREFILNVVKCEINVTDLHRLIGSKANKVDLNFDRVLKLVLLQSL